MKVLITGGAGYIGSTVASAFLDAGDRVVLLDDLSRGSLARLSGRTSYIGDVADARLLRRIFTDHPDIELAVHCAARTVVPESIRQPLRYHRDNVAKSVELVDGLLHCGCHRLIHSSSAAVYGAPDQQAVRESDGTDPRTPYAASKLLVERILADVCGGEELAALSLRYFNPIGCDPAFRTGPDPARQPQVLGAMVTAARQGQTFWIHGDDWGTVDGTPLRDFVDVWDVALAHVAAAHRWPLPSPAHEVVNIGSGHGTTVRQLAEVVSGQLPRPLRVRYDGRRPGDTVGCYAVTAKAGRLFGWRPTRAVADAVACSLEWERRRTAPPVRPAPPVAPRATVPAPLHAPLVVDGGPQ